LALNYLYQERECKDLEQAKAIKFPKFFTDPSMRKIVEILRKKIK
jgi:hypothetical protein